MVVPTDDTVKEESRLARLSKDSLSPPAFLLLLAWCFTGFVFLLVPQHDEQPMIVVLLHCLLRRTDSRGFVAFPTLRVRAAAVALHLFCSLAGVISTRGEECCFGHHCMRSRTPHAHAAAAAAGTVAKESSFFAHLSRRKRISRISAGQKCKKWKRNMMTTNWLSLIGPLGTLSECQKILVLSPLRKFGSRARRSTQMFFSDSIFTKGGLLCCLSSPPTFSPTQKRLRSKN